MFILELDDDKRGKDKTKGKSMTKFEMGQWFEFTEKINAIQVQHCVVP